MSDITYSLRKEIGTSLLTKFSFDVPSVSTVTVSPTYRFVFDNNQFNINELRVECGSTDFDFRFFDKDGVSTPTTSLVVEKLNESLFYGESLGITICNADTTQGPYIYGQFKNNDYVNNTGTITCAFIVR